MNTKQLIKLLEESDPKGEATVVIGTYSIIGADMEPGYWDGHYWKCLDKEGQECVDQYPSKMVLTGKGMKLKLHYIEPDSILWDKMTPNGMKIEDYIEFDSAYSDAGQRQEQKERWMKALNETYNVALESSVESDEDWLPKTKELFKKGTVVQTKSGTDKFWMTYLETEDKIESLMQGYIITIRNHPEIFEMEENADGTERTWRVVT